MLDLSKASLFSKLDKDELQTLEKLGTRKKAAADAALFFEGDPSDSLFVLLSGSAKVHQNAADGTERVIKILTAGEVFGEFAMLDGHPRSATVTTLGPAEIFTIARADFVKFAQSRPEVLWKIMEALCERIRTTSSTMAELTFRDVPYRLIAMLLQLCGTHGSPEAEGCLINLKLTAQELSSMVGASREQVSRLLQEFHGEGLVKLERNTVRVPDTKKLERALEYASEWS